MTLTGRRYAPSPDHKPGGTSALPSALLHPPHGRRHPLLLIFLLAGLALKLVLILLEHGRDPQARVTGLAGRLLDLLDGHAPLADRLLEPLDRRAGLAGPLP